LFVKSLVDTAVMRLDDTYGFSDLSDTITFVDTTMQHLTYDITANSTTCKIRFVELGTIPHEWYFEMYLRKKK